MPDREAKTQEQIACIFCGKSAIKDRINWDTMAENWDINWTIRQVRQILPGPGRRKTGKNSATGFPAIPSEGLSIVEMFKDPAYQDIVTAIKDRLLKIVKAYVEAGIIKRSELRLPREKPPS